RPPAEEPLPLFGDDPLEDRAAGRLGAFVPLREKEDAGAVARALGKLDAERRANLAEEFIRDLDQKARAVARIHLTAARAPVAEVGQGGNRVEDQLVRTLSLQVDEEAHTAGVVLILRVVEAMLLRQTG